jgi:hypothetical protein
LHVACVVKDAKSYRMQVHYAEVVREDAGEPTKEIGAGVWDWEGVWGEARVFRF